MRYSAASLVIGCLGCLANKSDVNLRDNALPWYFVEEIPSRFIFERTEGVPEATDNVMIFPIVRNLYHDGRKYQYTIVSPIAYTPGTPIDVIQNGVRDRWGDVYGYMVWKRGYFMTGINRLHLYSGNVFGLKCSLVEICPLPPSLNAKRVYSEMISALRVGEFKVGRVAVTDSTSEGRYSDFIRCSEITSWIPRGSSGPMNFLVTGLPEGAQVNVVMNIMDFKKLEEYLVDGVDLK